MTDYQNQIGALKQEKEEDMRQQRDLRNKIKTLQDRVEDLEHEEECSERKTQEVMVLASFKKVECAKPIMFLKMLLNSCSPFTRLDHS